jgi:hypothetical protein
MHTSLWRAWVATAVALCLFPLAARADLTLSGFVDTSFFYESLTDSNTFSLDEVELDIDAGLTRFAGLRADINFRAVDSGTSTEVFDGLTLSVFDDLSADDVMEQGYIWLLIPLPFETKFQFGKFNVPMGWELLDPTDMYQFSHALVFNFGIPTNVTGAMLAMVFNPVVDLQLYAVNGWDQLNDNNKMKTFGGRLGLTPMRGINVGLSLITGPELDNNNDDYRTVFDLDLTVELIPKLLIGGEFNYGREENTGLGGSDAEWLAGLLTLHYDFTDIVGLTFRFDIFNDKDGTRLAITNPAFSGGATQYALTFAPTFALADGVGFLVEFRYDKANEDIFVDGDGDPQDDVFSVAVEFTFSWQKTLQLLAKN